MRTVPAAVTCAVALTTLVAANAAQRCRESKDVLSSVHDLAANQKAGGHIDQHLADHSLSIVGKSMFENWATFDGAFNTWRKSKTQGAVCDPKAAENTQAVDCVDAASVGITKGIQCFHRGPNERCDEKGAKWKSFVPLKVAFRYRNSAEEHGKWTLISAYPTKQKFCPDN